jgi:zinc/manganese transport system ATP-binding protein
MSAVVLEAVTLAYGDRLAVEGVSGAFAAGRTTVVVGPNGSGKSTLLRAVAGLLTPVSGRIDRGGAPKRRIAYLPQDAGLDRAFPITVADLVALGLERRLGLFRGLDAKARADLAGAIEAVGLAGLERRPIEALSGGQLQRALFARVMAEDAPIILLDEPFAAQDTQTTADLISVIRRWKDEGRTLILVTHDLSLARALADETVVIARHCIAWGPTDEALTAAHLRRAHEAAARIRHPLQDVAAA